MERERVRGAMMTLCLSVRAPMLRGLKSELRYFSSIVVSSVAISVLKVKPDGFL
jgi:hypothetical protein